MPTGVVRHTETVKVTTRQTIVGGMPDDGRRAAGYDTGAAPVVSAGPYRSGPSDAEAYDLGGAEAGRYGTQPADYGRHRDGGADQGWPGGRWASARRDAWGSQVRMGERHAALRADESGSELHVADRWSSVHHYEQPGVHHYEQPAGRHGRPAEPEGVYAAVRAHDEPGRSARHRRDPQHSSDAGWFPSGAEDGRYGRQPVESGWADPAWASAPPDYPRRDDHARYDSGGGGNGGEWYGYPPADEVPRAGGARSTDLYPADGRWR